MPLFDMSPNLQRKNEMENGLKRSHDEYSGDEVAIDDRGLDAGVKQQATEGVVQPSKAMSPSIEITRDTPPPQSSPDSLTTAGTTTPARDSPSPNPTPTKASPLKQTQTAGAAPSSQPPASTAASSTAQPPAKRKRRTAAELEAEAKEKAQKKKEREEEKEAKQVEKAKLDAAKQVEKAKLDAEKQLKRAEKAKEEAEKQAKRDEKRRKKEEEDRKIKEEKEKKERAQPKLMSFFTPKKAPVTPKKESPAAVVKTESPAKASAAESTPAPVKEEKSEYEKRFKPFFVHETVRMAKNPFEMDEEAHAAKSQILDEYIDGKRSMDESSKFNPVEIFQLPCRPAPRGRIYPPVRYTMEKMQKLTQKAEGASEEDRKAVTKETADALRKIPVKTLRFWQDVRPPYKGTVTLRPYQAGKDGMRRLARNPTLRGLVPVNYDHDSEAEWESEGEDVDIDDDDEEDLDGDGEDMDEFLDDSEDSGPARFVSANGLEPVSTGVCWEDRKRMGPNRTMYEHRMEFILESLDSHHSIDPFSTKYWEPEPKQKAPKAAAKTADTSAPANAFQAIGAKNTPQTLPKKILENNVLQELKKVIQANPKIAKGGLIDLSYVALAHAKVSRNDIKEAITTIAERSGGQGRAGSWVVKPLYLD
ncbi:chromatin assembly factor 1 subunit a [Colletotrichum chrysophilum]|uniref:Chromatin assembly factor 1 subunit a n=1 Tax=Colletotrichum chrysophilum TaxID=1836956 RepID=A0AAD8ZY87_9PEZI|nr:chromatin assembly factor 1 subunit a [Colletotrichum chrysophilum]